jgi:hypothetical protein
MQLVSHELNIEKAGRDGFVRRRLPLWEDQQDRHADLMLIYRHWEQLRPTGLLPKRNEFDLNKLKPVMAATSLIDVAGDEPADYTIRLLGREIHPAMSLPRQRLGDLPSPGFRDMLMRDYYACKSSGVPMYHDIVARIDYLTWSYARLILPFARDGRNVDELMVCSVALEFPELSQRLQ